MPANPYPSGELKVGYIPMILAVGSSGIAAITWVVATLMMRVRSAAGSKWSATSRKSSTIAAPAILRVTPNSAKLFCTGRMIVGRCDAKYAPLFIAIDYFLILAYTNNRTGL